MWGPVRCSACASASPMPPHPERSNRQSRILAEGRYSLFTGSPKSLLLGSFLVKHSLFRRSADGHFGNLDRRKADPDRDALSIFPAGPDPRIEREVVSDHVHLG